MLREFWDIGTLALELEFHCVDDMSGETHEFDPYDPFVHSNYPYIVIGHEPPYELYVWDGFYSPSDYADISTPENSCHYKDMEGHYDVNNDICHFEHETITDLTMFSEHVYHSGPYIAFAS